jgi:hypothetical protein
MFGISPYGYFLKKKKSYNGEVSGLITRELKNWLITNAVIG